MITVIIPTLESERSLVQTLAPLVSGATAGLITEVIVADAGSRVSLFIDPDETQIRAAHEAGAPVIELHTGRYADAHDAGEQQREYERVVRSVAFGRSLGIKVNAGHGLHYTNVQPIAAIEGIVELNIGHAIVAHAIFAGWDNAVREMKAIMVAARLGASA